MKHANYRNVLKGVSTLDIMKEIHKFIFFVLIIIVFSTTGFSRRGHSTLDLVDPSFNPNVQSGQYGNKIVRAVQSLPDGKILALGNFTSFNRVPVGKLVRLNADGSLDSTFYTQAITSIDANDTRAKILLQPDGEIVVLCNNIVAGGQPPKFLIRLNTDGTLDTGFNYTPTGFPANAFIDSVGRIALTSGSFQTPQGSRRLIRLNANGSLDTSFNFVPENGYDLHVDNIAAQGNRLIVFTQGNQVQKIYRLDDNGAPDTTFTAVNLQTGISNLRVQTDNKILYLSDKIRRLNADGSVDNGFQPVTAPSAFLRLFKIADDGKIVLAASDGTTTFYRFLPNGASDSSFNPYITPPGSYSQTFTIQPDGGIVIGDQSNPNAVIPLNNFVRLLPQNGAPDPAFNPGGIGFQIILPGSISAIETQTDGKILLGGKFDLINDVPRYRLARLNTDSTVDATFQINTTATGNYFSVIREIYQIRVQSDGKVVVSGSFNYVINGATKINFVRLNSDGSIDGTFILSELIPDYSSSNLAGKNRFLTLDGGKVMVGTSRLSNIHSNGPLKFNNDGTRDTSFNSLLNAQSINMYIDDLAIQPDGKILVSGTHNAMSGDKTFLARLNSDGSVDSTFSYPEETDRIWSRLALLPNGKILIAKYTGVSSNTLRRLNPDGSADNSFNTVSIPGAIFNALLVLPNGKIFLGGKFTLTVNGQPAKNLLQLGADGNFEPTVYNLDEEVLALAADGEGRVLVGGGFSVIGANGAPANRSYVARLTDPGVPFDYDGDGKADISVFRPSENKWYILQSSDYALRENVFGLAGDQPAPADYDGDGITDVAIFRPSSGAWWYLSSVKGTPVNVNFGAAGDIPRPSDFDGDGKTDFIVYRPSDGIWYRMSATGQVAAPFAFGIAEDKPLIGDFDGDGKSDPAIFRPSTGDWWYAPSTSTTGQAVVVHWGAAGDIPTPADVDADRKTDFMVYRPSNGGWYILRSGEQNYTILQFGLPGDKPVVADYDGDRKADVAVFRPGTGTWYLLQTTSGFGAVQWGGLSDIPTENSFNH